MLGENNNLSSIFIISDYYYKHTVADNQIPHRWIHVSNQIMCVKNEPTSRVAATRRFDISEVRNENHLFPEKATNPEKGTNVENA